MHPFIAVVEPIVKAFLEKTLEPLVKALLAKWLVDLEGEVKAAIATPPSPPVMGG